MGGLVLVSSDPSKMDWPASPPSRCADDRAGPSLHYRLGAPSSSPLQRPVRFPGARERGRGEGEFLYAA